MPIRKYRFYTISDKMRHQSARVAVGGSHGPTLKSDLISDKLILVEMRVGHFQGPTFKCFQPRLSAVDVSCCATSLDLVIIEL